MAVRAMTMSQACMTTRFRELLIRLAWDIRQFSIKMFRIEDEKWRLASASLRYSKTAWHYPELALELHSG